MRAIVMRRYGGPEVLSFREVDEEPAAGTGEVVVDVAVSGVNFVDAMQRAGAYPVPLPFVPGVEGAGTVAAVGPDVADVAPGDRVAWAMDGTVRTAGGTYAERAVVHADRLAPVPPELDLRTAGAVLMQGMTAHYLTRSAYEVRPGDTALVHSAAGGLGALLTQMVKLRGGRVIGTVSTAEKEKRALDGGADHVVSYEDFARQARRLTGGHGVDVVYDGVGAATFDGGLDALRPRGAMVLIGEASGPVPPIPPARLAKDSLHLTRPGLTAYIAARDELLARSRDVFDLVTSGSLRAHVAAEYALADAAAAHRDLEARRTSGKLLLLPEVG
ncbi:quinone oxidoreductase [Spirillospora sp. NPDC049652]